MDQQTQTYRLTWRAIEIEARYQPFHWLTIAHLEIESVNPERTPLPVTETGYRSHFHPRGTMEAIGGEIPAQIIAWLDDAAERPD